MLKMFSNRTGDIENLIDVSDYAREEGITRSVVVDRAVWDKCCAWDAEDTKKQGYQEQSQRILRLLDYAKTTLTHMNFADANEMTMRFSAIPRDGESRTEQSTNIKITCHGGKITIRSEVELSIVRR